MNRRDFLHRLALASAGLVAGAELDLDRLLWVPRPMVTVPAMPMCRCGLPARAHRPFDLQRDYIDQAVLALAGDIDRRALAIFSGGAGYLFTPSERFTLS